MKNSLLAIDTAGSSALFHVRHATSAFARMRGWMFQRILPDAGLLLAPCNAVHTGFMLAPIDVVYLDKHQRVCKRVCGLKPWRLSGCLRARSVLELPEGAADALVIGTHIALRAGETYRIALDETKNEARE